MRTRPEHPAPEPRALSFEWQQSIDAFLEYRRAHGGVSDSTLAQHRVLLREFAEHVSPPAVPGARPDEITVRHIDDFLLRGRPLGRDWARRASSKLRTFLRYLVLLGHVPATFPSQVPSPRVYRLASLPRGLQEKDLRKIMSAVRRRDPGGRRDYAILMLFAVYGLRLGDVASLRLEDIRWRDGSITFQLKKTGRPHTLPLIDVVGDALADYLQHARPRSNRREVFLRLQRPFLPLKKFGISTLVGKTMKRAGVRRMQVVTHAFRHGFATRLVRAGVALDTVAECLGHASSETTFIYTKLAIEDLRSVSLDPREILP